MRWLLSPLNGCAALLPNMLLHRRVFSAHNLVNRQMLQRIKCQFCWPASAAAPKRPFVLTIAGGPVPSFPLPPRCHIVVFSHELLDGLRERADASGSSLHLIRARIDTACFRKAEIDPTSAPTHRHRPESGP